MNQEIETNDVFEQYPSHSKGQRRPSIQPYVRRPSTAASSSYDRRHSIKWKTENNDPESEDMIDVIHQLSQPFNQDNTWMPITSTETGNSI